MHVWGGKGQRAFKKFVPLKCNVLIKEIITDMPDETTENKELYF